MFSKSKRERLIYFCFVAWFIMGMTAMILNGFKEANINLASLAAYLAALSPFVIGYMYGETRRESKKQ